MPLRRRYRRQGRGVRRRRRQRGGFLPGFQSIYNLPTKVYRDLQKARLKPMARRTLMRRSRVQRGGIFPLIPLLLPFLAAGAKAAVGAGVGYGVGKLIEKVGK